MLCHLPKLPMSNSIKFDFYKLLLCSCYFYCLSEWPCKYSYLEIVSTLILTQITFCLKLPSRAVKRLKVKKILWKILHFCWGWYSIRSRCLHCWAGQQKICYYTKSGLMAGQFFFNSFGSDQTKTLNQLESHLLALSTKIDLLYNLCHKDFIGYSNHSSYFNTACMSTNAHPPYLSPVS